MLEEISSLTSRYVVALRFCLVTMDKFILWAKENRRTLNGQSFEHVSFPSFVKNFRLTDRSCSLADYTKLIASSELGARRRQMLQSSHDSFTRNRLHSFWKSWTQQLLVDQAQQELNTSSAVTVKKTAVLACEHVVMFK